MSRTNVRCMLFNTKKEENIKKRIISSLFNAPSYNNKIQYKNTIRTQKIFLKFRLHYFLLYPNASKDIFSIILHKSKLIAHILPFAPFMRFIIISSVYVQNHKKM